MLGGGRGNITVAWEVTITREGKLFTLTWNETDGPEVTSIASGGFGTVVLKRVAPQALSGTGDLQYSSNGVLWTLVAPMEFVEAAPANSG